MANKMSSTEKLRETLLTEIDDIRSGKIDTSRAAALAGLAGKILQSYKLDLDATKLLASLKASSMDDMANRVLHLTHNVEEKGH